MGITIKELSAEFVQQWDDYVMQHNQSTFFHLAGWKDVLTRAFSHRCYFLMALDDNKVVGILPLARIHSFLFSDSLISLPFSVYSGVLANTDEIKEKLIHVAVSYAKKLKVETLELRHETEVMKEWPRKSLYVTFKKQLDPDEEKNLMAIPRKQRAMVRKGIKKGLYSVEDENIDRMFLAYSESVRNLGTPIFAKKYLKILKEVFKDKCRILTVLDKEDQLIASVMSFYFKKEVLPYYGGGTYRARAVAGNDFMYWELMRLSVKEGIEVFDFGRSKEGTGSYKFKTHWGFEPKPLHYEVKLISADSIPEINPLNPKYQYFIKMWQKLPLPIANFLGPFLAKSLG